MKPATAFAEGEPEYEWVLFETEISPDTLPLQATFDTDMAVKGDITQNSATVTYRVGEGSSTFSFNFDAPPPVLIPGQKLQLKVKGEITTDREPGFPLTVTINLPGGRTARLMEKHELILDTVAEVEVFNFRREIRTPESRYAIAYSFDFTTPTAHSKVLSVVWRYRPVELLEQVESEPEDTPEPEPVEETNDSQSEVTQEPLVGQPETHRERMERAIARNLVDYAEMNTTFEKNLEALYNRANAIMEDLRDAQWFLTHGTDEDKEKAKKDIEQLQEEMKELMDEFNDRASVLEDVLDGIESQFVDYEQKPELMETLDGYWSQLSLLRINLALRSGNVDEFDELFRQYRNDENIADQILVGNAFRRLMTGDARTALESVKLALEEDEENPTALQLLQNLETYYLDIIRDKVAREQSQNARLFNDKLNGHGQEGVGSFLLDVLTTGVGESFQALAAYIEIYDSEGVTGLAKAGYHAAADGKYPKGYYDFLQEISSLNVDEATAQIVGIQFVKDLRQHGVTLDEMNSMTVPKLQEIVRERFDGRILTEEQATVLRKRIWDAFKNPDVEVLRKGEKLQLDVDAGRNYFDTEILQAGSSDIIMRQFSAWDTFLTFAPSAQLGKVSKLGVAQRLGLKAETTLQQGLQKGLGIEQLGHSLYQTQSGAAVIDATYKWNGFTEMVSQAVKKRVGDVAFATGSAAVQAAMSQMSAPARTALKNEILQISDYYLGSGTTATSEATIDTMSAFFGFIGLNSQALQRGAYGVEDLEKAREQIQSELTQRRALSNNVGVAEVSGRPINFDDFEDQVTEQGESYLARLRNARDRIQGAAQGLGSRRSMITSQADEALDQMEEAAAALRQGDRSGAQKIFESMQSGSGRNFDFMNQENLRKLGGASDTMRMIDLLQSKTPTDRNFAAEVAKKALSFTATPGSEAAELKGLAEVLTAASLEVIPE
ncbi:hypothetical protein ACFLXY_00025 [Chloroflexota bacterium]